MTSDPTTTTIHDELPDSISNSRLLADHSLQTWEREAKRAVDAEDWDTVTALRGKLRRLDSGRWHSALKAHHDAVAHSSSRQQLAADTPRTFRWVVVFAAVEGLNTFPRVNHGGIELERER